MLSIKGSFQLHKGADISLLSPKKNKDKTILQNLRPISLLNVDYKILTKVLAKRLEKVLLQLINADQTGYVKGRYIGENFRLRQDLMFYTYKENLPGMAIFVDFRKAFDTIEWRKRGVRQGCPLSGFLFVIGVELLLDPSNVTILLKESQSGKKK